MGAGEPGKAERERARGGGGEGGQICLHMHEAPSTALFPSSCCVGGGEGRGKGKEGKGRTKMGGAAETAAKLNAGLEGERGDLHGVR